MNLFIVRDGRLITNDERHSILLGITRDSVIEIARDLDHAVEVSALPLEDILRADEAFLTGTAVEVVPVREVDQRQIGKGSCGPITERLRAAYVSHVRARREHRAEWLTPV